ncbi:MAG: hypothetical protein FJ279_18490 [Planctomycetes bacterium]|nr:hypothetical protein [Planctomycetota bacterium]MBM4086733.1 hypothetical protein [Planctomycetota bacterium]
MIIDCHAHIKGGDDAKREFTADELLQQMDEAGIAKTCVFAMSLPSRESNDLTARRIKGHEDRLIPFCHIVPTEGDLALDELDRAVGEWGWKGVKMHFGEFLQQASLETLAPTLDKLSSLKVPLLVDTGYKIDVARPMVEKYPDVTFVIAHFGAPQNHPIMAQWARLAKVLPNCHLDSSYCHTPWKMPEAIAVAGADKVLFGTDAPLIHPLIEIAKIRACHLTKEDEEKILWRNAARVFRLS